MVFTGEVNMERFAVPLDRWASATVSLAALWPRPGRLRSRGRGRPGRRLEGEDVPLAAEPGPHGGRGPGLAIASLGSRWPQTSGPGADAVRVAGFAVRDDGERRLAVRDDCEDPPACRATSPPVGRGSGSPPDVGDLAFEQASLSRSTTCVRAGVCAMAMVVRTRVKATVRIAAFMGRPREPPPARCQGEPAIAEGARAGNRTRQAFGWAFRSPTRRVRVAAGELGEVRLRLLFPALARTGARPSTTTPRP